MRFFLLSALVLFASIAKAQFITNSNSYCSAKYVNNIYELHEDVSVTGIDIFPMQFAIPNDTDIYKTPTLNDLECLHFEFSFDPDSSEESKKHFIEELKNKLYFFDYLYRSPNLKKVYFHIGEKIFMSDAEIKKGGSNWQKKADMNLKNAWKEIGAPLQAKYPELKFYAENWNW